MKAKYDTTFARLRKQAGLTQKEVSDLTGINPRNIRRMEAGEIQMKNIALENALALAKIFGVDVEKLIEQPPSE